MPPKAVRQGPFLSLHGHQPRKRRIKRRLERRHGQVAGVGVELAVSRGVAVPLRSLCRAAMCRLFIRPTASSSRTAFPRSAMRDALRTEVWNAAA